MKVFLPRRPVLSCTHGVGLAATGRYGAFLLIIRREPCRSRCVCTYSNTGNAILAVSMPHPHTMPVYRSSVMRKLIVDRDFDRISPVGVDSRARVLAIDSEHWTGVAIGRQSRVRNSKLV